MRRLVHRGTAVALFFVGASVAPSASEAATPRERIANYVLFYYVGDPNNSNKTYNPQRLDPTDLIAGKEDSDFWRDTEIPGLQDLVRALVQRPKDKDTESFQGLVADLLDLRGRRIVVYLIDDAGQPLADGGRVVERRYGATVDDAGTAVWPSAEDDWALSPTGSRLAGAYSTGEVNLRSAADARSTFLHELAHIQALSDARPHLFTIAGKDYSYGLDGSHSGRQLLPELSTVYDEAIAGAIQMLHDPTLVAEAFEDLGAKGVVLVETARPDPAKHRGAMVLDDVWLHDQIKASGTPVLKTSDPNFVAVDLANLPGKFLLHNEKAMAVVIAESARRTMGYRGLLQAIYQTNAVVDQRDRGANRSTSRLTVNELALLLVTLGGEILGSNDPTVAMSSGGPTVHLLPLAYLDYMTARDAASMDEFGALFKDQLAPDWLSVYWQVGRPLLDSALPAATRPPRSLAELDIIASAFAAGARGGG